MTTRNDSTTVRMWVLCERYAFQDGSFAEWDFVSGVAPTERKNMLADFERPAAGEQVSERRVFCATVRVTE